ncbi:hypothetical protein [Streptomyces sp. NPDC002962]|uniref:hypothetical protein n=1 Tax=Streptomyces sp. NPDC002962 TaxID=3364674 RepID=UPI0036B893A2
MDRIFLGRVNVRSWPNPSRLLKNPAGLLHPLAHAVGDATHLHHLARKGETHAHKRRFDELVAGLVPYSDDYSLPNGWESLGIDDKSIQEASDRGILVCRSSSGQAFALDPKERWLALPVPDRGDPREAARVIRGFLREFVDDQDLRIDVDLVCQPGTILKGLEGLSSVTELEVTIRLPNAPAKSLFDAIRQMESVGATEKVDTLRSPRGLWLSREEVELLDGEASAGNVDVRAESSSGAKFDSRDHGAWFTPPFKISIDLVPTSLVLAILWIIQNWPPRGGGVS